MYPSITSKLDYYNLFTWVFFEESLEAAIISEYNNNNSALKVVINFFLSIQCVGDYC